MRNMIQLLGGVAVAGAVAAGSTAFTAMGLTSSVNTAGTTVFVGGSVTHNVVGGVLMNVTATTNTPGTQVTQFLLQFDSNTPAGRAVTLTTDGTPGGGSAPDGFWCQNVQANNSAICKAGLGNYSTPQGYFTAITSMTVSVS